MSGVALPLDTIFSNVPTYQAVHTGDFLIIARVGSKEASLLHSYLDADHLLKPNQVIMNPKHDKVVAVHPYPYTTLRV